MWIQKPLLIDTLINTHTLHTLYTSYITYKSTYKCTYKCTYIVPRLEWESPPPYRYNYVITHPEALIILT